MCSGLVNRILPFSSVDGPGNRSVIFLQGCDFDCLYCHNPETINLCNHCGRCVEACPYGLLSLVNKKIIWNKQSCRQCGKCLRACNRNSSPKAVRMNVDEVVQEIIKVKSFISGITVSGGECTLQLEFLTALLNKIKKIGLTAFVDTNGSVPLYDKEELVDVMDMAMIDVKAYDPKEHEQLTGIDNKIILENVKYLAEINKLYEVRTIIAPEILNNQYNVDMISKMIVTLNPRIRYKLIKYRPIGVRTELVGSYLPTDEMMNELLDLALNNGCEDVNLV